RPAPSAAEAGGGLRRRTRRPCAVRSRGGKAAHGHLAQDLLLLVRAADDLFEGGDEFALVVDQAAQGGQARAAGEFADIPGVLGEHVVGAFLGRAGEVLAKLVLRGGEAVESAR